MKKISKLLGLLTPGIIMAMAGVGVGDLATASIVGSKLGTTILWAVIIGAFMKFFITEGCARWQLKTGTTILEGCMNHLGMWFKVPFIIYFVLWSYFVSGALISATGVAATAIYPAFGEHSKVVYGILHSLLAGTLIFIGGFKLFARIMEMCAVLLFITVMISISQFDLGAEILSGIFIPTIPMHIPGSVDWTVALIGGVGGTLTVICYGYWIREKGRNSVSDLRTCRIDLGVGYLLTALFGMAMVVIGSKVQLESGKGFNLLYQISQLLEQQGGRWVAICFLVGAWGAIFSSMMGVWQSAPYILSDFVHQGKVALRNAHRDIYYRLWLAFIVIIPMLSLFVQFTTVQKFYSYFGALVVPFLTIILLILGRKKFLAEYHNRPTTVVVAILILLFFTTTILALGIIPS